MATTLQRAAGRLLSAFKTFSQAAVSKPFCSWQSSQLTGTGLRHQQGIGTSSLLKSYPITIKTSALSAPTSSCTGPSSLLQVAHKQCPVLVSQVRAYHVRVALKKRCASCYFVRRKGRLFVECKAKPRHKQMQVLSKRKAWREDYSKGNIKRAIYWNYDSEKRYYKMGDTPFARHDWIKLAKGKIGVTL